MLASLVYQIALQVDNTEMIECRVELRIQLHGLAKVLEGRLGLSLRQVGVANDIVHLRRRLEKESMLEVRKGLVQPSLACQDTAKAVVRGKRILLHAERF